VGERRTQMSNFSVGFFKDYNNYIYTENHSSVERAIAKALLKASEELCELNETTDGRWKLYCRLKSNSDLINNVAEMRIVPDGITTIDIMVQESYYYVFEHDYE
jgi:hypothetical protein